MKLSIITEDGTVCIDNYAIFDLDISSIASNIHAVQWDNSSGWIEYLPLADGSIPTPLSLTSITSYQSIIDAFEAEKTSIEAAKAPLAGEEGIRATRDGLLSQTDVWALSDRTMTDAQTAYRQALRDIPAQEGFPTTIIWPTKPE